MGKLCERPGCSDVAAMAYGFDVDRLLVWLAVRDPDADPARAGSLCKRHADAMVVPRGWTLDDRREAEPRLFRPKADEAAAPAPPRRRPRRKKVAEPAPEATPQPTLTEPSPAVAAPLDVPDEARTVAEVTGEPSATDDPDATQAIPWLPTTFDEQDDLDVLSARSPLLARAFKGTDRKR